MLPLMVIIPPTWGQIDWVSYAMYLIIGVGLAIFATEYAAWRIMKKVSSVTSKFKGYEEKIQPILDLASKLDPKQIDTVIKNIGDLTGTIKLAIEKPKPPPMTPEINEENEVLKSA